MTFINKFVLSFIFILLGTTTNVFAKPLHVLHLSFHKGCINEINFIAQQLEFNLTSIFIHGLAHKEFDGQSSGAVLHNIGHERALNIWNKHKDYFNQFDVIITSDTAPLSRIFLQNNFTKPLIIWVCNRFDYADPDTPSCNFPDEEYYQLLRTAFHKNTVFSIPYTAFESVYAAGKNVFFNNEIIQPIGTFNEQDKVSSIPDSIDKSKTFFIPPYLNDAYVNLAQECTRLGITAYRGRYNGPNDLKDFKGIIHIPYSWSNLAFFENIQLGLPYFIPSSTFIKKLYVTRKIWWPNGNFLKNHCHLTEWYNEQHNEIITYFDSWDDLKQKIESTDFAALRIKIQQFAETHRHNTLEKWRNIFNKVSQNS